MSASRAVGPGAFVVPVRNASLHINMNAALEPAQLERMNHPASDWDSLYVQQREAATYGVRDAEVKFVAGPVLIIAGAGTGKTSTLAHRVAHLRLNGVDADRILLLTFTRRAAEEMIRRAERIVQHVWMSMPPHERQTLRQDLRTKLTTKLTWAGTFHSIANRLLRIHSHRVGLDPSFSVLDRGDSADLLDVVRQELGLAAKEKRFPRKDTCLAIYSHRLNTQGELETSLREQFPWCLEWHDELKRLYREYVRRKQAEQLLDYDDLLLYWQILMSDGTLASAVGAGFDHVLVDEYQDTNTLQADILLRLKPDGTGLTVVGDDAQAIYGFRAANVRNILDFPLHFSPAARVVTLTENYRSTQPILAASNAVI